MSQHPSPARRKSRAKPFLFGCLAVLISMVAILIIATIITTGNATKATTDGASQPAKAPAVTHGRPHIGGPLSDFYGKYGQPKMQGSANSETWTQGQIILSARPDSAGHVDYISVSGPASQTAAQTVAECAAYLPAGASAYNTAGNLTDYHSSAGDIVLTNAGSGVCTLSLATS